MNSNLNWTGRIARYFIYNEKLTLLGGLFLFGWGALSFAVTPKKYNPTIVAPAFRITIDSPGSSREEILEHITKPLESVVSDIPGVEDVYSVTTHGGRSVVQAQFFVGEDFNAAKIAINDRIQSDMDLAPLGIPRPNIASIDAENVPVLTLALDSDSMDSIELRKFGFKLRDRLSTVTGATRISVVGGRRRELSVLIDHARLGHYALTLDDVEAALRANNVFLQAGTLKTSTEYVPLEAVGWVRTPTEVEEIVVVSEDAIEVRLKDFAEIRAAPEEIEDHVRHIKKDGSVKAHTVLLSVAKLKGTNISTVCDAVLENLEGLSKDGFIPPAIRTEVIVNDGATARDEINKLLGNLGAAILIVTIILFIFLSFHAAVLVALAIPLSLCAVFGSAFLAGQDINRITLFALILSLGLLVDNATVVIENIVRKVGSTRDPSPDLFVESVDEVGPGLVMSTVTTVLAFLPMAFITGMMGPYMGPIPFFVPAALIFSLILSLSLNPWMASRIIRGKKPNGDQPSRFAGIGDRLMALYRRWLHSIISSVKGRWTVLTVIAGALLLSAMLPLVQLVKFRMLPKADVDQFFVYLDLPAGTPLEETDRVSRELETALLAKDETVMVQTFVGRPPILDFNGLFKGVSQRTGFHLATLRVGLVDDKKRTKTSERLVQEWRIDLQKTLNEATSLKGVLQLIEDPPGPPVRSTLLLRFQGWDEEFVAREAQAFLPAVGKIEGVTDIDISLPEETETLRVVVNHFEASKTKVSPAKIVKTLNTLYAGKIVGIFHHRENIEQEVIRLRFARDSRVDPKTLENIKILNRVKIEVPLKRLVRFERGATRPPVLRENHVNTVYVTGEMTGRSVTYAGIDLLRRLFQYRLASGDAERTGFSLFGANYRDPTGRKMRISLGGEWELTLEVFRDLGLAMLVALLIIYCALVAQFKSFAEPLIIMSTIPLSIIGVFPGFMILGWIRGEYFTATSMIGVIALAGIAVNNAIILLEYLNALKAKGGDLDEAIVEAASTRLRPIALTTITTMLGSMTIIGDPVWAGLAWAVILGLAVSSSLVLVVFPVLYRAIPGKHWPARS